MRALITGVTGFAGRAMALLLASRGWSVIGSHGGHLPLPADLCRLDICTMTHKLTDPTHTMNLLRDARPDYIFHLAGRTGADFGALLGSHAGATANLLEAARQLCADAVIVIPGSSAQFGDVPQDRQPITEEAEYQPSTLYGIAKTAEAWTAAHYQRLYSLKIIRTHTFNCIGPGQRPQFVPATFARQIVAIERGTAVPVLFVGNLQSRRDMIDIRDVASAYLFLATRGRPGRSYNICSGQTHSIGALVERLRDISRVEFEIRRDPERVQSIDIPVQRGDPSRLQQDTGWHPTVPLDQSLADVLEEWRAAI
jgi:GDP-4-dehydro-6-deoxy-D-mannose reductase